MYLTPVHTIIKSRPKKQKQASPLAILPTHTCQYLVWMFAGYAPFNASVLLMTDGYTPFNAIVHLMPVGYISFYAIVLLLKNFQLPY